MELQNKKNDPQVSAHQDMYKYNGLLDNQHNRRNELLNNLKRRRNDQVDELRGLNEFFDGDASDSEEPVNSIRRRRRKRRTHYGGKLMLSEWLSEVPMDLEYDWIFKICPVGVRNIVVAHKGITKVYNRRNQMKGIFHSNLPGGNENSRSSTFTLLDCVYRDKEKTYYVLDVLVWNSHSCICCSTEFRFFFIKNKLLEDPQLSASNNKYKFVNIDYHLAVLPTVEDQFTNDYAINDIELPVDGVLFYHKECTYMSGRTPLVGWLKPYMLPEKLQVPVNESYLARKPKGYITLEVYLEAIKRKYQRKSRGEIKDIDIEEDTIEESDIMDE